MHMKMQLYFTVVIEHGLEIHLEGQALSKSCNCEFNLIQLIVKIQFNQR